MRPYYAAPLLIGAEQPWHRTVLGNIHLAPDVGLNFPTAPVERVAMKTACGNEANPDYWMDEAVLATHGFKYDRALPTCGDEHSLRLQFGARFSPTRPLREVVAGLFAVSAAHMRRPNALFDPRHYAEQFDIGLWLLNWLPSGPVTSRDIYMTLTRGNIAGDSSVWGYVAPTHDGEWKFYPGPDGYLRIPEWPHKASHGQQQG